MEKEISSADITKIANDLVDLFINEGIWKDTWIYFLESAYSTEPIGSKSAESLVRTTKSGNIGQVYVTHNISIGDSMWYGNILRICSGIVDFTDLLTNEGLFAKMDGLVKKYGLFFDISDSWNAALFFI